MINNSLKHHDFIDQNTQKKLLSKIKYDLLLH